MAPHAGLVAEIGAASVRAEADGALPGGLAGHSMGGKVAAVLVRRALDGAEGLDGLRGLVLVSPSPPSPEPMGEEKRAASLELLGESAGTAKEDRARAGRFVDQNVGKLALPDDVRERAVDGVLAMNRTAFRAWMDAGSKEDWSGRVGLLDVPAIVFAGTEDAALGPEAQTKYTLPHLPKGELVVLAGSGHLGPLERAGEVVERITEFVTGLGIALPVAQAAPGTWFTELLKSDRVSPNTRDVMTERMAKAQVWSAKPTFFNAAEFRTLRALAARVVPGAGFDMAAALDAQRVRDVGDGWRFADLPPDGEAWRKGLQSLEAAAVRRHGVGFVGLTPALQDDLLRDAVNGKLGRGVLGALHIGEGSDAFDGARMKLWFEDARAACAQTYMADARTMDRVGFTGFADDLGFTQIELGQQEEFER